MSDTRVARSNDVESNPAEPKKKSSTRTLVLLVILLLLIAAYAHDYFIAAPAAVKGHADIEELVHTTNAKDVSAGLVTSAEVQKTLGKSPSKVTEGEDYTLEIYRYWGGMMPQRQYISVLYVGKPPRRYDVHHLNAMPEPEEYPGNVPIPANADSGSTPPAGSGQPAPPATRSQPESPAEATDSPAPSTESDAPATDGDAPKSDEPFAPPSSES